MSLFVKKQINYTFTFTEEELKALYELACSCLQKVHDDESNFNLSTEQYLLLGKLVASIEENCGIPVT